MLILKCHRVKNVRGNNSPTVRVNSDGNADCGWKITETVCFKNIKKLPVKRYTDKKAWINTAIFIGF